MVVLLIPVKAKKQKKKSKQKKKRWKITENNRKYDSSDEIQQKKRNVTENIIKLVAGFRFLSLL